MSEIRIHRCRLRLVRRNGWSWGPDPRTLLQAAVRALPALLAAALEDLWTAGEDEREISAPVRLRLRVRESELIEALAALPAAGRLPDAGPAAALARRLAAALAGVLGGEVGGGMVSELSERVVEESAVRPSPPGPLSHPHSHSPGRGGTPDADSAIPRRAQGLKPLATREKPTREGGGAVESSPRGRLFMGSQGFEPLVGTGEAPGRDGASEGDRLEWAGVPPLPGDREHGWERGPGGEGPPGRHVKAAEKKRRMRAGQNTAPDAAATGESTVARPPLSLPGTAPVARPQSPAPRPMPWRDAEVHVASALPFLLLGPLSRTGYLDTLAAVFADAGLFADLPLFAAALAYKVLPPPERGWRRSSAAMSAAAACAGLLDPVSDSDLSDLARRALPCLDPLAADLSASLLAGHEPGRPFLLAAAGEGLLLAEADGVFPIAWAPGPSLPDPLPRSETLLVPAATATPALLRELDATGVRFVTDAAPTRGETWHPLRRQAGQRLWTNDPAARGLARQAAGLAAAEDGARRLWQALAVERPSVPRAAADALDRHLTLAAGLALGTLAWTLWRDREPVDPVLALERFGDLDARVRFRDRSVHVLLPMGRRHHDLFAHRLLEPVRDAAWLGGRVLEFGGG